LMTSSTVPGLYGVGFLVGLGGGAALNVEA
jgi:hypothetical protein